MNGSGEVTSTWYVCSVVRPAKRVSMLAEKELRAAYIAWPGPYVNYPFPRSPAECSAVPLCRGWYGRRYSRRGRRLSLVIGRPRCICMAQVTNILGPSSDPGHPSRCSRRRRHCRPRWVVVNDGGSFFTMLVIGGAGRNRSLHQRSDPRQGNFPWGRGSKPLGTGFSQGPGAPGGMGAGTGPASDQGAAGGGGRRLS